MQKMKSLSALTILMIVLNSCAALSDKDVQTGAVRGAVRPIVAPIVRSIEEPFHVKTDLNISHLQSRIKNLENQFHQLYQLCLRKIARSKDKEWNKKIAKFKKSKIKQTVHR